MLTSEKVGIPTLEVERRKEEEKRIEIEMWRPIEKVEEKPGPIIKIEEEKIEEEKEKVEESKEEMEEGKEKAEERKEEKEEEKEKPKEGI